MKIIPIEQRSPEWFEWRKQGITASEFPVIMGVSPYKTRWQLWAEKTGLVEAPDLTGNPNIARGIRLEDEARYVAVQLIPGIETLEPWCIENDDNPLLKASLDGYSVEVDQLVELKCPSESVYSEILLNKRQSKTFLMYEQQVKFQLLVAGITNGWLCFYMIDKPMIRFSISLSADEAKMFAKIAADFWLRITNNIEPEKGENDIYVPKGDETQSWLALANDFKNS